MQEYIELHAVLLKDPESRVIIARNGDGDGPEEAYHAACELARMVGIGLEDG
jgi:hypothetical protein